MTEHIDITKIHLYPQGHKAGWAPRLRCRRARSWAACASRVGGRWGCTASSSGNREGTRRCRCGEVGGGVGGGVGGVVGGGVGGEVGGEVGGVVGGVVGG